MALSSWLGFTVALMSCHMLAAPPQLFDPQASKLLGRWLYLTYQSNVLCTLYFSANLVDGVLLDGLYHQQLVMMCKPTLTAMHCDSRSHFNIDVLMPAVPLCFALGTFLTLSYYALDHSNPENYRRKERCKPMYPYVHWCSHLEHGHALPIVMLHTATMSLPSGVVLPTAADACRYIGPYILFYVVVVHVNRAATGSTHAPLARSDRMRPSAWKVPAVFDVVLLSLSFLTFVCSVALSCD